MKTFIYWLVIFTTIQTQALYGNENIDLAAAIGSGASTKDSSSSSVSTAGVGAATQTATQTATQIGSQAAVQSVGGLVVFGGFVAGGIALISGAGSATTHH